MLILAPRFKAIKSDKYNRNIRMQSRRQGARDVSRFPKEAIEKCDG